LSEPVTITKNGRARLVVLSAEEFARLNGRDRQAIRPEELSEPELAAVGEARMPIEHAGLDAELKDGKP
jgi:PHD/YefM family antitoxin component YafN of YafNO toxin-antitoxin module